MKPNSMEFIYYVSWKDTFFVYNSEQKMRHLYTCPCPRPMIKGNKARQYWTTVYVYTYVYVWRGHSQETDPIGFCWEELGHKGQTGESFLCKSLYIFYILIHVHSLT